MVGQSGRHVTRNTFLASHVPTHFRAGRARAHRSGQMTEAVTINNDELAISCDIVSGWGVQKWAENPGASKKTGA